MHSSNYMTKLYGKRLVAASNRMGFARGLLASNLALLMTYQHEFCFFACSEGKCQHQSYTLNVLSRNSR